jgi:hypothetical protein
VPSLAVVALLPEAMQLDGGGDGPSALAGFAGVLRGAGVTPRVELRGPDGQPATGVTASWLHHGDAVILALQTTTPWSAPAQIEVQLTTPALVEDLRLPGPVREVQQFTVALDPITPTILSIRR